MAIVKHSKIKLKRSTTNLKGPVNLPQGNSASQTKHVLVIVTIVNIHWLLEFKSL